MQPIIFIPGIEATNLIDANSFGFNTAWNAYDTLGTSLKTTILGPYLEEQLQMDPLYDVTADIIIERESVARLPYEKSLVNLKAKLNKGKVTGDPIYLFGYDWRLSNAVNGERLQVFVQYLANKLKGQQVTGFRFITHSMGALVFCSYLARLNDYSMIDKVVLCAPPFLGSPYSLVHMVKGNGGMKSFLNKVFGNNEDIRKVVRTYPSIFELLACYPGWMQYADDSGKLDLLQIDAWQSNIYDDIRDLFAQRLQMLAGYRWKQMQDLGLLPPAVRGKMVVLAGAKDDTLTYMYADKKNGATRNFVRLDMLKQGMASGDGTVPLISSSYFMNVVKTISIDKDTLLSELGDNLDYHGFFLRDSRVQNIIARYFADDKPAANTDGKQLLKNPDTDQVWFSIGSSVKNLSPF